MDSDSGGESIYTVGSILRPTEATLRQEMEDAGHREGGVEPTMTDDDAFGGANRHLQWVQSEEILYLVTAGRFPPETPNSPYLGNMNCTWARSCQLFEKSGRTTL